MLHAGLDLSRRRLDFCLLDEHDDRVGAYRRTLVQWSNVTPWVGGTTRRLGGSQATHSIAVGRMRAVRIARCGHERTGPA